MQASGNFHCDEHNRTAEQKTELHRTTMTIGGAVYQITRHYGTAAPPPLRINSFGLWKRNSGPPLKTPGRGGRFPV